MIIFAALVALYIILVYIGIPLAVPYWKHNRVPAIIPDELQNEIGELNKKSSTDEEFVKNAYLYITHKYYSGRFKTLVNARFAFDDPFSHPHGYLPCHLQNYILKIILIKSGRFGSRDIKSITVFLNFFIHQYLKVKVNGKWIFVDPAGTSLGVPFGKRAIGFR
jgi:hypothetical protein